MKSEVNRDWRWCDRCRVHFCQWDLWEKQEGPPKIGELESSKKIAASIAVSMTCPECRHVTIQDAGYPNDPLARYCPVCAHYFKLEAPAELPVDPADPVVKSYPDIDRSEFCPDCAGTGGGGLLCRTCHGSGRPAGWVAPAHPSTLKPPPVEARDFEDPDKHFGDASIPNPFPYSVAALREDAGLRDPAETGPYPGECLEPETVAHLPAEIVLSSEQLSQDPVDKVLDAAIETALPALQLSALGKKLLEEFTTLYPGDLNCWCTPGGPCHCCAHDGNPKNLAGNPAAWEPVPPPEDLRGAGEAYSSHPIPMVCGAPVCDEPAKYFGTGAMAGEFRCGVHTRVLSREFQELMQPITEGFLRQLGDAVDATFVTEEEPVKIGVVNPSNIGPEGSVNWWKSKCEMQETKLRQLQAELESTRVCFAEASQSAGPTTAHVQKLQADLLKNQDLLSESTKRNTALLAENQELAKKLEEFAGMDTVYLSSLGVINTQKEEIEGLRAKIAERPKEDWNPDKRHRFALAERIFLEFVRNPELLRGLGSCDEDLVSTAAGRAYQYADTFLKAGGPQ